VSLPNSADFALIRLSDGGATPVLTLLCGVEGVTINRTTQTSETYQRDCDVPNRPGQRKLRVTGSSWSISGSGADNIDLEAAMSDAFGVRKPYQVSLYKDDGTDEGEMMGTYAGNALMTTRNQSYSQDNAGTLEITLEGEGLLAWTAAA